MFAIPLASICLAQDDPGRAQIAAATTNAANALQLQIASAHVLPDMTVAQFLTQTGSMDRLADIVSHADQIGGPRWIDDQTCQVKLEVSGASLTYTLVSIAAVRPKLSPIPADALEQRLADWKRLSFSATGMSISPQRAAIVQPPQSSDAWAGISDESRRGAIDAARQDAVNHIIDAVKPIDLGSGQSVGDVLSGNQVRQAVANWLGAQPITDVRFRENLQVDITVSAPPDALLDAILDSAKSSGATVPQNDPGRMILLRQEFTRRIGGIVGRANAASPAQPKVNSDQLILSLPRDVPDWVGPPIEAEAASGLAGTRLRTKSAAENRATDNLRTRIGTLSYGPRTSIDDAARSDPRVAAALDRALLRAHIYRVQYNDDGSVMVRITLDSHDLWYELQQTQ